MLKRILPVIVLFVAIACVLQASAQSPGFTPPSSPNVPKYDGDKLIFPDGFRTNWMFVGSNFGLQYKGEGGTLLGTGHTITPGPQGAFHNVYITPESYAGFRASKTAFPDPTILVIDIYSADPKKPDKIVAKGFFDGDQQGALVAVKDSTHPYGSGDTKSIWSYYVFSDKDIAKPGSKESWPKPEVEAQCIACHKKNGLVDNVWVQFYPMLRDAMKATTK
jgi:hypothetical protein